MLRAALALVALAACDAADGPGLLAFSEADTGALVVVAIPSGERTHTLSPPGAPGALALSPDRARIAYAVEPVLGDRRVLVGELATDQHREVGVTGELTPAFTWGAGGWFFYGTVIDDVNGTAIVDGDAGPARALPGAFLASGSELASPTEPRIVYVQHDDAMDGDRQLVSERADGSQRRVLATAAEIIPVAFTPDGERVLAYEARADGLHLVARAVASGAEVDLGPAQPIGGNHELPRRGPPPVSADGREVLTLRGGALVALRVDGLGARAIADVAPRYAGFTGAGDVVFVVERNLSDDDVPDYHHDLHLEHAGTVTALELDRRGWCEPPTVAADGGRLAWACSEVLSIIALPGGAVEHEDRAPRGLPEVLGFDRDGSGIVIARHRPPGYTLHYTAVDGTERHLGDAGYGDTPAGIVEGPPFSFVP